MNTETMNSELLWRRMQKDWQSAQPAVDASALVRQINRRSRIMSTCLTVEIVLAFVVTGPFAYIMFTRQGVGVTLHAILLAVIWISVFAHIWIKSGTWRAQGTDTRALLQLVERRARAGIRYAWLQIIGAVVACPLAGVADWYMWHAQDVLEWIILGALAVGGTIWAFRLRRRQLRKLKHTRVLLEQLSREDGNP